MSITKHNIHKDILYLCGGRIVRDELREKNEFKAMLEQTARLFDDLVLSMKHMSVIREDGRELIDEEKETLMLFSLKLDYLSKRLREIAAAKNDWDELSGKEKIILDEVVHMLRRIKNRKDGYLEVCLIGPAY